MKTTYIIASCLSFLPCLTVSAQIAPLGDPGADLYYLWNQRVKAASSNDLDFQLAPYIVVRDSTSPYALSDRLFPYWSNSEKSLRWFVSPAESFQSQQNRRSAALERLRGGVTVSLSDKIYAQSFFILDERLATDPLYTGKVWRGLAGDVETATISYAGEKLTAVFGRYRSSWGPTLTNLLLSQDARPLDGLTLRYRLGRKLTFSYQLSRLDGFSADNPNDTVSVFVKRFYAAHRVDLRVHQSLRIGLFESVIFAGPGRGLELQFFNPLIVFHANQLNEDNNDNTFLGIDADWWPVAGVNVYGQFLIDDFQIENNTQGDQEPNELGWILGTHLVDQIPGWDLRLQWDKVANRTYNQKLPRNRYLNQNRPLGHPLGNDFELYQVHLSRWWAGSNFLRMSGLLRRSGEGSILAPWTEPWLQAAGDYSEPFPTGIVERQITARLEVQAMFPRSQNDHNRRSRFMFDASVGWTDFKNEGNTAGQDRSALFANLGFTFFFAGDWNLD